MAAPMPEKSAATFRRAEEAAWIEIKRIGQAAKYRNTCRHLSAFNVADVTRAQPRSVGKLLLCQVPVMTRATQADRHNLFEVHGTM